MFLRLLRICQCLLVKCIFIAITSITLSACDDGSNYAPVADISGVERLPNSGIHLVKHGESLYEIAWRYGLDYRLLAAQNQLKSPYVLRSGQRIRLRGGHLVGLANVKQTTSANLNQVQPRPAVLEREPSFSNSNWIWPSKGVLITSFSSSHKGINIAGQVGDPICASASGKVVYSGNGLRGYGNLIIIKHNSLYLSAYAHNQTVFVKEGDWVKQGQKIAEMGKTGTNRVMLHFELRRAGKPIDPVPLINSGSSGSR